MVCRDTPSRSASSYRDSPAAQACFMASFFPMPYSFSCQPTAVTARSPQIGPEQKTGNRSSLPMVQDLLAATKKSNSKCCWTFGRGTRTCCIFCFAENQGVAVVQPPANNTPPGCCIQWFKPRWLRQKSRQQSAVGFWQGHKDLNPEPTVLETAALPIELYPYICKAKA